MHSSVMAKILITRTFGLQVGSEIVPANNIKLIDDDGAEYDFGAVRQLDKWDPLLKNRIGEPGAFKFFPDAKKIQDQVELIKSKYPKWASAKVQDNSVLP